MFFFGSEEELRAKIDQAHMTGESVSHDVERFLDSLDEEGLRNLNVIVSACDSEVFRGYTHGRIAQINSTKFGICAGCGTKHDDDLKKLLGDPTKDLATEATHEQDEVSRVTTNPSQAILLSDEDKMNMAKYHIDDAYDENEKFVGFACMGTGSNGPCGMIYTSIEDRMLRDPDECSGCILRTKFG